MSLVKATPRSDSDGTIVRQFGNSVDTYTKTYTYETSQDNLSVWNKGYVNLLLNVGTFTNVTIKPNETWINDVVFDFFTIATTSGMSEIQITAREYDNKPVYKKDISNIVAGTVSPELLNTINNNTSRLGRLKRHMVKYF